jgi:hypothetical protein
VQEKRFRVERMIIMVVRGVVPRAKQEELEARYAYLREDPLPAGIIRSTLMRGVHNPRLYSISTVWTCTDAVNRCARKMKLLPAEKIFQTLGIRSEKQVFEVLDTVP